MAKLSRAGKCTASSSGPSRRVRVVGALVERGGKVLVTRRRAEQVRGGLWEFPGGKVEPGETDREALARELREELGVDPDVGGHFLTHVHAYPDCVVELAVYRCTIGTQRPVSRDVDQIAWVSRADLLERRLTPPDIVVAREWVREACEGVRDHVHGAA